MTEHNDEFNKSRGKISDQTKKWYAISGQVVEIRKYEEKLYQNGIVTLKNNKENFPPLSDGHEASEIEDLAECSICLRVFHVNSLSLSRCPYCEQQYCKMCEADGFLKEGYYSYCCINCYEEHAGSALQEYLFLIRRWLNL